MAKPKPKFEAAVPAQVVSLVSIASATAREVADDSPDAETAITRLIAMARADSTLFTAIMEPGLPAACRELIARSRRIERRAAWVMPAKLVASPQLQRPLSMDTARAIARNNVESFLDGFKLTSGKRLRDALRADVIADANFYIAQATDMSAKGRFLQRIAERMTDDKKSVGDQVTEDMALSIRDAELAASPPQVLLN